MSHGCNARAHDAPDLRRHGALHKVLCPGNAQSAKVDGSRAADSLGFERKS
jgi:hypothetical protein